MAMLNHWSNFILLQPAQRLAFAEHGAGAGVDSAWEQHKLEARKLLAVGAADSHLSSARREASPQGAVLGAFCLLQFTHKRTLPKNANQMKNTTKPNSFLARETIRGYTFDTNINPLSARLALNRSGKDDFKFSLAANSAINFILS
jgi:hypothetical protein